VAFSAYSGYRTYRGVAEAKVNKVDDPNQQWLNMQQFWELPEVIIQGTQEIRSKHRKYLPQEERESDLSYDARLSRSVLSPYFIRIERMLAGMLIRKPVQINDTPDVIREALFNIDLGGNDISIFTYELCRKLLRYGHCGCLVDAPSLETEAGRPYWTTYTPRDIIGWRTEKKEGRDELVQLRLAEQVLVNDGLYGVKEVQQIRVLTPGGFEIHRKKKDKSDWVIEEEGTTSLDYIPFSVAYANKVGYMESRPPMNDIAELNLKHYQIQSDYDNILHISAVPMLSIFGMPPSDSEISAGPGEAFAMPAEARIEYIEPGGSSFSAQQDRLKEIASQINELGLAAILGQKIAAETATSKAIDRSQSDATLLYIAQQVQDLIDNSLRFHADYLGVESGSCYVNRDFLATRLEPQEIGSLLQLYTAGTISKETLLKMLSQGEVLPDEFDIEEELEATEAALLDPAPPAIEAAPVEE
jgi:hypothetical protein